VPLDVKIQGLLVLKESPPTQVHTHPSSFIPHPLVDVSFVIVSYNVAELLEECIRSIVERPADGLNVEIIVVDNASRDSSVELVRQKFPDVRLIANIFNYGFPRGCNQGLRAANGRYIFFLNPDARIVGDGLEKLVNFLAEKPDAGVVAPILRYADGSLQPNRRRFPGYGLAFVESTILERYPPFKNLAVLKKFKFEDVPPETAHQVDWVVGAAFLVRREVCDAIGGLDERFFMYSEELDFCRRVKNAGWEVWYTPAATVVHVEGKSSGQDVPARHINFHTSKISYYRKHYGRVAAAGLRGFLLATYGYQYAEEWLKLRLGHKPELRRERLWLIKQVFANGFRPYRANFPRPVAQTDICLLTAEYPPQPGGVGDYTERLAHALNERGAGSVSVLSSELRAEPEKLSAVNRQPEKNSSIIKHNSSIISWNWKSLLQITRVLKLRPAHVVNIQYQTGAYRMHPAVNFLPLYLRLRLGVERPRVVTTFHDLRVPYLFPKAGRVRTWVNQLLLKSSDAAIVTNAEDLRTAQSWGAKNVQFVPIGSNIVPGDAFADANERAVYRAELGIGADDFAVGYFGLSNRSKGIDTLLEAFAKLQKEQTGWKLVIIGGETGDSDATNRAYADELRQLEQRLGISSAVIRTGHLPPDATSRTFYALDAVALPFRDGASFRRGSLLAPLAHGVPVVTTYAENRGYNPLPQAAADSWGYNSLPQENLSQQNQGEPQLEDGKSVLLVAPENPSQLADALNRLRQDIQLRARLTENGRALAKNFEWSSIADRLLAIFERI
jgi:N-acetylglucosaminyl-diphospho-decaprenol L-rhamnosyltransferase